jgi:asparagine synthase (glutamine-hydrolysing)
MEPANLRRAIKGARHLFDWKGRYFEHFTKVPERHWKKVLPDIFNRSRAHDVFINTLKRSVAEEPSDQIMHWELQTYLPGLFQQDDRMSMANSLESRVPLADPRLVRFAFHTPVDQKLRAGASKWILRKAVSDVLPNEILNRRKVGFDTPAETWMRTSHRDFVIDTLTSTRARERGFWNNQEVSRILLNSQNPFWFDLTWKLLCVELWSQNFLDVVVQQPQPEGARHVA